MRGVERAELKIKENFSDWEFDMNLTQKTRIVKEVKKFEKGYFQHEGTQIVCTVSIPESPIHFLRLLV